MLHAPACALLVHKVFGVEGKVQGVTGPALWGTGPLRLFSSSYGEAACSQKLPTREKLWQKLHDVQVCYCLYHIDVQIQSCTQPKCGHL